MSANQLINMALRILTRKAVNKGLNAGVKQMSKGNAAQGKLTPEERAARKQAQETAKRAKQAARLARRLGKF